MQLTLTFWWILGAGALQAAPTRQGWLFEHLAAPPAATYHGSSRHQLIADAVSYSDLAALRAGAMLDLGLLELRASAFRSVSTRTAKLTAGDALGTEMGFEAEVARYSVTPSAQYGRLALEVMRSDAAGPLWIALRINAGTLETATLPWKIGTLIYLATARGRGSVAVFGADVSRLGTEGDVGSLRFGAAIRWVYWFQVQSAVNPNENMMFSVGPTLTWQGTLGTLEVSSPLRIWIDKFVTPGEGTANPSELTAPAVRLSASFNF